MTLILFGSVILVHTCDLNVDLRTLISQCENEVILTEMAQISQDIILLVLNPQPFTASHRQVLWESTGIGSHALTVTLPSLSLLGMGPSLQDPPGHHDLSCALPMLWGYIPIGVSQPELLLGL